MTTTTATPAAETQVPAAASPAAGTVPAVETKPATGSTETKGVSGEPKAPAATPAAPAKPESAETTLLGKKLPPADPAKAPAEAPKDAKDTKAEEYEVALPEGSLLGADHAKAMSAEYRKLGLSKDQAQAMAAHTDGILKGYVDQAVAKVNEVDAKNWETLQAHPKYGGANLNESNKFATAALDKFFPGLKAKLINSPYAADPDLFGGLVELGKMIGDAKFRMNGLPPEPPKPLSPGQVLYGVDGRGLNAKPKEGATT